MKLKKYNDFNQINEADKNDGANILPQSVKDNVNRLLEDLQDECGQYDLLFDMNTNKDNNQVSFEIIALNEELFTKHIRYLIKEWSEEFNIEIYKELDSQTTQILFKNGEDKYIIPLITTMGGGDMIYKHNIKYKIWINTYVAKKL